MQLLMFDIGHVRSHAFDHRAQACFESSYMLSTFPVIGKLGYTLYETAPINPSFS